MEMRKDERDGNMEAGKKERWEEAKKGMMGDGKMETEGNSFTVVTPNHQGTEIMGKLQFSTP
jgi:hypothetical protein